MGKPPTGEFPSATSAYEDLAALHQLYTPYIHNNAKFLIWHRYFLWTYEQVLRAECGFDRAFPWWDETLVAGNFHSADLFTSPEYFGELPGADNGNALCVTTGAFAGLTCHIGPGTSDTPHCLARAVDESLTAQCSTDYDNLCQGMSSYADMEQCVEDG
jgi:tyrosinase